MKQTRNSSPQNRQQALLAAIKSVHTARTTNFIELVSIAGLSPERDFRNFDLSGTDLSFLDLRKFRFDGTLFHGCDLRGTDLRGTGFRMGNAKGAVRNAKTKIRNSVSARREVVARGQTGLTPRQMLELEKLVGIGRERGFIHRLELDLLFPGRRVLWLHVEAALRILAKDSIKIIEKNHVLTRSEEIQLAQRMEQVKKTLAQIIFDHSDVVLTLLSHAPNMQSISSAFIGFLRTKSLQQKNWYRFKKYMETSNPEVSKSLGSNPSGLIEKISSLRSQLSERFNEIEDTLMDLARMYDVSAVDFNKCYVGTEAGGAWPFGRNILSADMERFVAAEKDTISELRIMFTDACAAAGPSLMQFERFHREFILCKTEIEQIESEFLEAEFGLAIVVVQKYAKGRRQIFSLLSAGFRGLKDAVTTYDFHFERPFAEYAGPKIIDAVKTAKILLT